MSRGRGLLEWSRSVEFAADGAVIPMAMKMPDKNDQHRMGMVKLYIV